MPDPDIPPEDVEFYKSQRAMRAAMDNERARQEELLLKDAIRLLRKDRISLDDISETFLFRKLLVAAWSTASVERQWAIGQLMLLKGLKPKAADRKKSAQDDVRLDMLEKLKPTL